MVSSLISILLALLVGAASPGPSFVMVSRIAVSRSRGPGIRAAMGMGAGGALFAVLAIVGLGALLQKVWWLDLTLKTAGGLYLIHMALRMWRGAASGLSDEIVGKTHTERPFLSALLTQISNPKTAVVYTSIFAALMPSDTSAQFMMCLPPLVFIVEAGWYTLVAVMFSSRGPKALYMRFKGFIDRLAASVLGILGSRLVYEAVASRLPRS